MRPLAFRIEVDLQPPSSDDKRADHERLKDAIGMPDIETPVRLLRMLPGVLRERGFSIRPVLARGEDAYRLAELDVENIFGIALDIGTTNIAASLYNLKDSTRLSRTVRVNPQTAQASDILSRMHLAMSGGLAELHESLIQGVNGLIEDLAEDSGIRVEDVFAVTVASNTVLTHFLLGLDVSNIPVDPYIPVVHSPGFYRAGDIGISVHPSAAVYIFPNAGSYVGGDIIAGIISSGIHLTDSRSILIDVVTNAEIVIGMKEWLVVGAGAAGPALEEGVSRAGMRAQAGAIYRMDIDPVTLRAEYRTIGDKPPSGICGSGFIDLVAGLCEKRIIDSLGRFREGAAVSSIGGEKAFIIDESDEQTLGITEREISNFLRTKAAMYTSISILMEALGLVVDDIEKIFIAGALGAGVRVEKAIKIGMLPDIPPERYVPIGNSSLKGAELLLMNGDLYKEAERIRSMITYREMNSDPAFMMRFPEAIQLPLL
jgi:uncharacterized 2Fe-2S/4Fe-4S cluster protein (DUF4445 family)